MHNILKKVILLGVVYDTVYELLLCIISIVDVYLPVILSSRRTLVWIKLQYTPLSVRSSLPTWTLMTASLTTVP
mgnify:CR=1 FL=1